MTAKEIAEKYVHGKHDALTDSQEKKDMANDVEQYANEKVKEFAKELDQMQSGGRSGEFRIVAESFLKR